MKVSKQALTRRQHVSFVLPALHGGGVERVFLALSRGMAERGLSVELVVAGGEGVLMGEVDDRVALVNLRLPPRLRLLRAYRPLVAHLHWSRPYWVLPAWDYLDLVPLRAAWASGASVLYVLHNTSDYLDDLLPWKRWAAIGSARWVLQTLLRQEAQGRALMGAVSRGVLQDFAKRFRLPLEGKEVFPNPLDVERVRALAQSPCSHPWALGQRPFFLAVGRLHPQKSFDLLIQAFARFKEADQGQHGLLVLGEGPERGRLEALVDRLGLGEDVSLPGFFANPYPCLLRAKAFVLTSAYEGFPMVILEALALGVPIVAAEGKGGIAEALDGGRLGLVVSRSTEALARAMEGVASGRHVSPAGKDVQAFLEKYRLDRVVEFYLSRMGM